MQSGISKKSELRIKSTRSNGSKGILGDLQALLHKVVELRFATGS